MVEKKGEYCHLTVLPLMFTPLWLMKTCSIRERHFEPIIQSSENLLHFLFCVLIGNRSCTVRKLLKVVKNLLRPGLGNLQKPLVFIHTVTSQMWQSTLTMKSSGDRLPINALNSLFQSSAGISPDERPNHPISPWLCHCPSLSTKA